MVKKENMKLEKTIFSLNAIIEGKKNCQISTNSLSSEFNVLKKANLSILRLLEEVEGNLKENNSSDSLDTKKLEFLSGEVSRV